MEFFATADLHVRPERLQRRLVLASLPRWCASIEKVLSAKGERGEIYCVWGTFRVHREVIRNGVRFTMPGCPNALQWTVTADRDGHGVTVHCTIDRREHDADFVESLELFVQEWKEGLEKGLALPDPSPARAEVVAPLGFSG